MTAADETPAAAETLSSAEIITMLRSVDRRLRQIELVLATRQRMKSGEDQPKRSRGRPAGSRNVPRIKKVGEPLFDEHADLSGEEIMAANVVEAWCRRSKGGGRPSGLLSPLVHDEAAWTPPPRERRSDSMTKAWQSLCGLRTYAKGCAELRGFAEVVGLVEHAPIGNPRELHRGLELVTEFLKLKVPLNDLSPAA